MDTFRYIVYCIYFYIAYIHIYIYIYGERERERERYVIVAMVTGTPNLMWSLRQG